MNQFSELTLTTKSSPLENITLHEYVDINVLEKLINSTLLKETFNNPFAAVHKTERNQLIKYKSLIKDTQYAEVKYNSHLPYLRAVGFYILRAGLGLYLRSPFARLLSRHLCTARQVQENSTRPERVGYIDRGIS